jgi:hypothetical protein
MSTWTALLRFIESDLGLCSGLRAFSGLFCLWGSFGLWNCLLFLFFFFLFPFFYYLYWGGNQPLPAPSLRLN